MSSKAYCLASTSVRKYYEDDLSPPPRGTSRLHRAIERACEDYKREVQRLAEFHMSRVDKQRGEAMLRTRLNPNNDPRIML